MLRSLLKTVILFLISFVAFVSVYKAAVFLWDGREEREMSGFRNRVVIAEVKKPSVAFDNDIREGDYILSIDGEKLNSPSEYQAYIAEHQNIEIALSLKRDGEILAKRVALPERSLDGTSGVLGVGLTYKDSNIDYSKAGNYRYYVVSLVIIILMISTFCVLGLFKENRQLLNLFQGLSIVILLVIFALWISKHSFTPSLSTLGIALCIVLVQVYKDTFIFNKN